MKDNSHTIRHPQELLRFLVTITGKKSYHKLAEIVCEKEGGGITTMYDVEEEIFQEGVERGNPGGR